MSRKFDPRESGSIGRNKDDDLSGLHRSPEMEIHGVSANTVGTPCGIQEAQAQAAFEDAPGGVDSMTASAAAQGRTLDYQRRQGTPKPVSRIQEEDVYADDGPLSHLPVAQAEGIHARDQEDKRHGGVARAAEYAGIDRAKRCRESVSNETREGFEKFGERARAVNGPGRPRSDYFDNERATMEIVEDLTAEEVEALWDAAETMYENMVVEEAPPGMIDDPAWYFTQLARQFVAPVGSSIDDAFWEVVEECKQPPGVQQKASEVRWSQYATTVEGTIVSMFRPDSWNQAQVGYLRGEDGETYKVTVWRRSNKDTRLQEGQRVRLVKAKVGAYGGSTTFAVDGEAEIKILTPASDEHAHGPVRQATASGKRRDAKHDWHNGLDPESVPVERLQGNDRR